MLFALHSSRMSAGWVNRAAELLLFICFQVSSTRFYRKWRKEGGERMTAKSKGFWNMENNVVCIIVALCTSVIVILPIACTSSEPKFVVKGTVKDATTGQAIAGAKVSDDGYGQKPYKNAITAPNGNYRYITWAEEHSIVAQAPGYKPQRQALTTSFFQTEKEKVLDFMLVPE